MTDKVDIKEENGLNIVQIVVIVVLMLLIGSFVTLWILYPLTEQNQENSYQNNAVPAQARCEFTPQTGVSLNGYCNLIQRTTDHKVIINCNVSLPAANTTYNLDINQIGRIDKDCANVGEVFNGFSYEFTSDSLTNKVESREEEGISIVGNDSVIGRTMHIRNNGCCVIGYSDVAP